MNIFKKLYNGFIWGMLLAILCSQSEWLELRINIINLLVVSVLMTIALGFDRLVVLPASIYVFESGEFLC